MLLEKMVSEPEVRIGEVSLLSGEEREQVLVEWNRTEAAYREECVHELFEEQAGRTPEGRAVEHEGEGLSYAELNRRANQLAHYLQRLGVGPEVRVGICMERSLEMVVSVLAVLKAGGVCRLGSGQEEACGLLRTKRSGELTKARCARRRLVAGR